MSRKSNVKYSISEFDQRVILKGILQAPESQGVRCLTCNHRCFLAEGKKGICSTRVNMEGTIHTLNHGNISSISNNPIEKKPFFHFAPGTKALTVGSWGCNATCPFCQNYDISKQDPSPSTSSHMSPESFVNMAVRGRSEGTSISLNEAATLMLEWNIEVFRMAHGRGLYNTIVTNGYMTTEALDLMIEAGLDAANVDIKGCNEGVKKVCGIDIERVWENLSRMREKGVHVEVTTLVVPGLADDKDCLLEIATRIVETLGRDTPWHVNRYFPHCQYQEPKTPIKTLLDARGIGWAQGLEYVYIGNMWQDGLEDTLCPDCNSQVYQRLGFRSKNTGTDEKGNCTECGHNLGIRFWTGPQRTGKSEHDV
ncbi:MAG: AmmeMemoRadiSam system radical SAM enzyme [Candidatus Thorarchaeota archaeon]|jgi:pyruvate formate lyase activating enzyme